MAIGDLTALPSGLQNIIQTGMLERRFHDALRAQLAYDMLSTPQPIRSRIGATITDTRLAELAATTIPNDPTQINSGIDNGLTSQTVTDEQYTLKMSPYLQTLDLNILEDKATIAERGLKYGGILGRQAQRTRELLARNAILGSYMGGHTRVCSIWALCSWFPVHIRCRRPKVVRPVKP